MIKPAYVTAGFLIEQVQSVWLIWVITLWLTVLHMGELVCQQIAFPAFVKAILQVMEHC